MASNWLLYSWLALLATGLSFALCSHTSRDKNPESLDPHGGPRELTEQSSYPDYCSKPDAMKQRVIPSVSNKTYGQFELPKSQILQVHTILRHGARTPYRPLTCWENYGTYSLGNRWDCRLKSLSAPAKHPTNPRDTGMFLFEKNYDALKPPLHNKLNGTCLLGQLIDEGYDMELTNGRHLRSAYLDTPEDAMRLFDTPEYENRPYEDSTYFRVDDEERTLMSGQILISGIFDVQSDTLMKLHTADDDVDVMTPNENVCPRLVKMEQAAKDSPEYRKGLETNEAKVLMKMVVEELRPDNVSKAMYEMIDCLMTTYCTDRPMPEPIDDFVKLGENSTFNRLYKHSVWRETFHYTYNNSAYAKLGMGPLWSEIYRPLSRSKRAMTLDDMKDWNLPRLLLFSGHDTTLMPLLASLGGDVWDGEWIPYASMMIIESHAILSQHPDFPSNHGFRLLLNGQVITRRVEGCSSDLCDLDILLRQIEPLTTSIEKDCLSTTSASSSPPLSTRKKDMLWEEWGESKMLFSTVFSLTLLCCALSSFVTYMCITGILPPFLCLFCPHRNHKVYDCVQPPSEKHKVKERRPQHDHSHYSTQADDGYLDAAVEITSSAPVGLNQAGESEELNGVVGDTTVANDGGDDEAQDCRFVIT